MIQIDWNPLPHVGPVPVNWYGLTFFLGFALAGRLVWKWAPAYRIQRRDVESLLVWIAVGVVFGARFYYVVQNDLSSYLHEPWRILMMWEGGLAYFGGLFGAILAGFLYCRARNISFCNVADLFAPAIPLGSAVGRISCGLDGMDYGTPTSLPWGVVYTNPASYAPVDGIPRHPDQFYELAGDLLIAFVLVKLRPRFKNGTLFLTYLVLFACLRFLIFFVRGSVPPVAFGLNNGQWTALGILAGSIPLLVRATWMKAPGNKVETA